MKKIYTSPYVKMVCFSAATTFMEEFSLPIEGEVDDPGLGQANGYGFDSDGTDDLMPMAGSVWGEGQDE